jgi:3-dehydroquinate dehydratase-1
MILKGLSIKLSGAPQVVGTIHSPRSLTAARLLRKGAVDLLEIRADAFATGQNALMNAAPRLNAPLIVTARIFREGGAARLSPSERRLRYEQLLPHAAWIDTELASAATFAPLLQSARARGVRIILSFHDFRRTPPVEKLRALARRASDAGADLFKVATLTQTATDLARLLSFLSGKSAIPLSVMGMGRMGKISRLLFASAGSVLNYGYLGEPQVSGQWPAPLLKMRLAELAAEG